MLHIMSLRSLLYTRLGKFSNRVSRGIPTAVILVGDKSQVALLCTRSSLSVFFLNDAGHVTFAYLSIGLTGDV